MSEPKQPSWAKPTSSSTTSSTLGAPAGGRGSGGHHASRLPVVPPDRPPRTRRPPWRKCRRYGVRVDASSSSRSTWSQVSTALRGPARLRSVGPAEEDDRDEHPQVGAAHQLHDQAGDLLVARDRDAPQPVGDVVDGVDRALGEGQPGAGHRRDDRHDEQVDHLRGRRDAQLGERPAHRHPEQERGRDHERVHAVVEQARSRRRRSRSAASG